jgi:hypothetical protein
MCALNRRAFIAKSCAGFGGMAAARWAAAAGLFAEERDAELAVFNAIESVATSMRQAVRDSPAKLIS